MSDCAPSQSAFEGSGCTSIIRPSAPAAIADGIMIEVHNDPAKALSDGAQSLTFEQFDDLTKEIRPYAELAKREF